MNYRQWLIAVLVVFSLVVSACAAPAAPATESGDGSSAAPAGEMTFVGTPRNETLILDNLNGSLERPENFNPYTPGVEMGRGYHEICLDNLWDIDTVTGDQFPALAAEMPTPLNDDYTSFEIKLREGIYWDDGVEFTSDDVIFTLQTWMDTETLAIHGWAVDYIAGFEAVDKYTVRLDTTRSQPRLSKDLGVTIWDNRFYPMAKHIWESQDPTTFEYFPPVCIGQYKFSKTDPNGNWTLWELRDDWERTSVGQITEKSGPKYILWNFVGTEEKRILAMIANDVDILQDITPESMEVLTQRSDVVRAWHAGFPYADFDDPCERGISFNNSEFPYDQWQVRWALALATDIKNVSLGTFAGMLRVSPLGVPPVAAVQNVYHKPLVERLQAMTLPDGYAPFDPNFALDMAKIFQEQGVGGDLPTTDAELIDLFGVGWWKYDTEQAAKLLEDVGFTRNADGKWLLPDGTPWSISINAPSDFEVQSGRLAYAVADSWSKFGIDASVKPMTANTFWTEQATGQFEAGSYWPGCAIGADIYPNLSGWHQKFIVPTGEPAPGNVNRHASDKIAAIMDELEKVTSDDPRNVELSSDLLMQMAQEMHWIPMFGTSKFVPVNETYFTNYPTADNYYEGPWWWWSNFKFIAANIQPKQ
ncbi:MAG: ABC transporter substrate-binding protein [Caldilineaceae bacterium]|nr:ABC transporter substrate-binding protein [Caldilineaceae bacterium]